ncbi:class I SAM-dependent methyltransferase [Oenococcus sp.]|uniref:class I SAM-dependent methyltransferase n=1 Tax=Oenococcus sp. TaxID=1979414 RepID=UPI0039E9851E
MTDKNEQYFTAEPSSQHDYQEISFDFSGKTFFFKTDAGVFSKNRIDYGTRVLLDCVADHYSEIRSGFILDLGCGYGVVGVALKSLDPMRELTMTDINLRSLALAKENLQRNQLDAEVLQSNIYDGLNGEFAAIVVNPPIRAGKQVVTKMLTEAREHLSSGGMIFAVLQKKQGAPSAEKNLMAAFGNVEILKRDKGYYVLRSTKQ